MEVSVIAVPNRPADDPGTGFATSAPLGRKVYGGGYPGFHPGLSTGTPLARGRGWFGEVDW